MNLKIEYLIVDGYNIIFAWPELEKLKDIGLSMARDKLINIIVDHAALTGQQVIIVFDATHAKIKKERSQLINGVEVIYTEQDETADQVIEKMVKRLSKQGTVYVATSDCDEQRVIFGQGAYRLTPKELWINICMAKEEMQNSTDKNLSGRIYLEDHLVDKVRLILEKWRREKG